MSWNGIDINDDETPTERLKRAESSILRLFIATRLYHEKDSIKGLSRKDFINAFNTKITEALYNIVSFAPDKIQDFLYFLVEKEILKHYVNNINNNIGNAIIISTATSNGGAFERSSIKDIFVLSTSNPGKMTFSRTNLEPRKTLPPDNAHILSHQINLDPTDGTVDNSDLFNLERFAELLISSMSEGLTVTFSIEDVSILDEA